MLTVWGRAESSAVARVMWTIGELGLEVSRRDWGGGFGGGDDPAYRALQPAGKIPALVLDDGRSLWESAAIIRYLCRVHAPGRLIPLDPFATAQAEAFMDWSAAFGRTVGALRTAYRRPDATPETCAPAVAAAAPVLAVLEKQLAQGPWVMGTDFGIADLALGVWAHRLMRCPPELGVPTLPALSAWYGRLCDRPAFAAQVLAQVSVRPQRMGMGD